MLHALATIGRYRLHIAHLNHGLRGAESDADAAYVASLAHKMAMPATISQADVPSNVRQRRRGLEDAARRARYSFLSEVASQANAAVVALGHTADDQAETLLLNLLRGAGLRGLRGMLALSEMRIDGDEGRNKSLRLFRPLLSGLPARQH
jgi:tRNA(Ile)-lysidine synthase